MLTEEDREYFKKERKLKLKKQKRFLEGKITFRTEKKNYKEHFSFINKCENNSLTHHDIYSTNSSHNSNTIQSNS